ncbi:cortical protein marker for cell polarity-domain-containing protein [Syncephalis fuscata]|nr:cortical protein marker for cell polarity-domain-containing protein [Syncephalis fuscata]
MSRQILFNSLFLLLASLCLTVIDGTAAADANTTASETETHPALSPLDIKQIGLLGVVGKFDGFSIRTEPVDTSLISLPSSATVANNRSLPATLIRRAGASVEILGQTSSNGTIDAVCILPRGKGDSLSSGVDVFVGGRFSSIGSLKTNNIARYDPIERKFFPLERGVDGPVRSLLCDRHRQILYVGGRFRAPVPEKTPDTDPEADPFTAWGRFGGGIAKWQNNQWMSLPFKGVGYNATNINDNNPANDRRGVNALALSADGRTVIVGGGFTGTADSAAYLAPNSQPINLGSALISAGATSTDAGQNNPQNIVCSAEGQQPSKDRAWLMQNNAPGYWRAQLPTTATISLLKIKNTQVTNRGVKTFSVNSLPDNGLITLSYFDADAGRTLTCREKCPLKQSDKYQYFHVAAENQIEGRGINFNVIEWYGLGGGLASIELFQKDVMAYADNRFNFPACAKTPIRSESSLTGTWSSVQLPSLTRPVMQYTYTGTSSGAITFKPNVPEDGFYEIYLLQPGCDLDQSCERRNLVDVSVLAVPQSATVTTTVDQSIRGNRRVLLYTGLVAASAGNGGFAPQITLSIAKDARALASGVTGSIVADAIQFVRLQTISEVNGVLLVSNTADTGITWNALNELLPSGSIVNALQPTASGSLFIGGSFRDNTANYTNIVEYTNDATMRSLPDAGVNGPVNALADTGDNLWIGGGFTHTSGNATVLLNLAPYSYAARQWQPSLGVDGPVSILDGHQSMNRLFVAGSFQSVSNNNTRRENTVNYATLNLTSHQWDASLLAYGNGNQSVIQSSSSYMDMDNIEVSYIGGSQRTTVLEGLQSSSAAAINPRVESAITTSDLLTTTSSSRLASSSSGVFYKSANGSTGMAIAGQFTPSDRRIAIWEQGQWHSLASTLNITSIEVLDHTMMIGSTNGVALYPLNNGLSGSIPSPLSNGPSGTINRLVKHSDQSMIVGGSFSVNQKDKCRNICQFNLNDQSWHTLGDGLSDTVIDMTMIPSSKDVVAATSNQQISIYNNEEDKWHLLGSHHDSLPGPITSITLDGSTERVIIAGQQSNGNTHYLMRWIEDRYEAFGQELKSQSSIRQLAMVPLTETMSSSRELTPNFALLVIGQLYITGLNDGKDQLPLDAALFDGKVWRPYLHTASTSTGTGTSTASMALSFIQRVFFEFPPLPTGPHYLAIPLVILISAAISLGFISLIVLLGLLVMLLRRRRKLNREPLPPTAREVATTASMHPGEHQSFADGMAMIPGATSTPPFGRSLTDLHQPNVLPLDGEHPHHSASIPPSLHGGNESLLLPADMAGALTSAVLNDDMLLDTANYMAVYARYPFSATEPGELEFRAGDKIYVLDNSDDVWWMGMVDNGPGVPPSQGVFPASYASDTPPDPSPWNFF